MPTTHHVTLTDHDEQYIEAGIAEGRFADASEAIHAGLHLLEHQASEDELKLERLRNEVRDGLDALEQGHGISFSSMEELASHIRKLGTQAGGETSERECA